MTRSTKTTLWWLGIVCVTGFLLYHLRVILLPFVLGMGVAYLLDPVVDRIQRFKISRGIATLTVTVVFFTVFSLLLFATIPLVSEQLAGLTGNIPQLVEQLSVLYNAKLQQLLAAVPESQVDAVQNAFGNVSMVMMDMLTTFANDVFASGGALLNIISMLLITPIVAFYLLKDWDHILQVCDDLLPRKNADTIRTQMHLVDLTISGFLRGQLLVCLCLALYYSVTLTVVGLPFGLLVGVATGALAIIPYVGWISSCALALLLAYMHGGEGHALLFSVAAVYLCAQAIESYFLTPKLVGERVGLHPLWLIFGMLAGGTLLGFVGVLLAVPATAVIGVLIRFAIGRYRESELYSG